MPKSVSPKRTALGKSKRSKKHSPMGPRPKHKGEAMNRYMAKLRSRRKSPARKSKKSPMRKSKKSKKSPTRKSKK